MMITLQITGTVIIIMVIIMVKSKEKYDAKDELPSANILFIGSNKTAARSQIL